MKFKRFANKFMQKRKRPGFLTVMMCIDCENLWEASNISKPCPRCASNQVVAMARWQPAKYGMPMLGKTVDYGKQPC